MYNVNVSQFTHLSCFMSVLQVLRYDRGGSPLWIAHEPSPTQVPDCQCGAKRQFEFQVGLKLLTQSYAVH